ncbi:MAG: hypothetical protein HY360_16600 [Verrucomicrobia bacterium]|nr:hypothetical protein [Verrucomicrobiota bacterium]
MEDVVQNHQRIEKQILIGTEIGRKNYRFNEGHDPNRPVQMWFQESLEGKILFIVFYSQACRWSRCLGCNLPSKMSKTHVNFKALMAQMDDVFSRPEVLEQRHVLKKVIVSNNGSVLDEATFSSTALMYLIAKLNLHLPNLSVLSLETRAEYVDFEELEFIARAMEEGDTPTTLELGVGFEVFDDRIRNEVFFKGLELKTFEKLVEMLADYKFQLKCYFMQKPVMDMSDAEAILDIHRAIDYLNDLVRQHGVKINLHLNPTYAAVGTILEQSFRKGEYSPPRLMDVARSALHGRGKDITIFLGLSDEGLACEGGSFLHPGEEGLVEKLEAFNRTQDYHLLSELLAERENRHGSTVPGSRFNG